VATDDGGPADIVGACENGLLVDPLDSRAIGCAVAKAISDRERWATWSENGIERVHRAFSWESHAAHYAEVVGGLLRHEHGHRIRRRSRRLEQIDRMLVTDIDNTLTGDDEALDALRQKLETVGENVAFAVATGRTLAYADEALATLASKGLRAPNVLITASGTQLHYGIRRRERDRSWEHQIDYRWNPERVREVLAGMDGLAAGPREHETRFRLHYAVEPGSGVTTAAVRRALRKAGLQATVLVDHGRSLEVIPVRASPGLAIRFICFKWNLAPERLLVAGDSGNDLDMLSGDTLGVVVGNHTSELEELRDRPRIYFAEGTHAWGIVEGIDHYRFLGEIRVPDKPGYDGG
jgi:sucrose-phosphate synthase